MKRQQYAWVIAYVDCAKLNKLPSDLAKNPSYKDIVPHIPMVRVLKKQFKNKDQFEDVPLLFNYGFFRIPISIAINTDMMLAIKDDINCISGWVRDGAKHFGPRDIDEDDEEEENPRDWVYTDSNVMFATVKEEQISHLVEVAKQNSIFSSDDITRIQEGQIILLMGYPFEGMQAKVIKIDQKAKRIKVILALDVEVEDFSSGREISVHFENVYYTIYAGSHDENYNTETLLQDYNLNKKHGDEVQ